MIKVCLCQQQRGLEEDTYDNITTAKVTTEISQKIFFEQCSVFSIITLFKVWFPTIRLYKHK